MDTKNSNSHNISVNERAFYQIKNNEKKIEGRLDSSFFAKIDVDHEVIFNFKENKVKRYVQKNPQI